MYKRLFTVTFAAFITLLLCAMCLCACVARRLCAKKICRVLSGGIAVVPQCMRERVCVDV